MKQAQAFRSFFLWFRSCFLSSAAWAVRNADVSTFVNTGSRVAVAFFHGPRYLLQWRRKLASA